MTEQEQQTHVETHPRPTLRAAVRRAIARQAAQPQNLAAEAASAPVDQPELNGAMPAAQEQDRADQPASKQSSPAWQDERETPTAPRYEQRFRAAADRAAARARTAPSRADSDPPTATASALGRTRTRPRFQKRGAPAQAQLSLPAPAARQPLPRAVAPPQPQRKPLSPAVIAALSPDAPAAPEFRRPPLVLAMSAGLLWALAGGWLLFGSLGPTTPLSTRLVFGVVIVTMGLLTWAPLQWAMRLRVLTWRGTVGWGMLLWTLAFVPPPTRPIVAGLADLPVYLLLFGGVFLASHAVALPLLYVRGLQRYHVRAVRFDQRRPQRQANEFGLFLTLCCALAAINALTIVSMMLMIAILVLSEMMFLFWEQ